MDKKYWKLVLIDGRIVYTEAKDKKEAHEKFKARFGKFTGAMEEMTWMPSK